MDPYFERAQLLMQQGRYELALQELRRELADEPNDPAVHGLIAQCLRKLDQFQAAAEYAQRAVHLAPDMGFVHHVLAEVFYDRRRYTEAQSAAEEAVRLEPEMPDHFVLVAKIALAQRDWAAALEAAETGLTLDPDHIGCANLRAWALVHLGRKTEASDVIDAALARDPDNPRTHANRGWALLEQGKPNEALEHFDEALRLAPNLELAQAGVVKALQARNIVYRVMLRFFFWVEKLDARTQWSIILGAAATYLLLYGIAGVIPSVSPFIVPILVTYAGFVLMTWFAGPLFELLLQFDRRGRLALSRDERVGSTLFGLCLFAAATMLALSVLVGLDRWRYIALILVVIMLPVSRIYRCDEGWPRIVMVVYSVVMIVCTGIVAIPWEWIGPGGELKDTALLIVLGGMLGAPLVANFLPTVTVRR